MNPKGYTLKSRWNTFRAAFHEAKKDNNGFTLIDVMIALIVMALLMAAVLSGITAIVKTKRKEAGIPESPEPVVPTPAPAPRAQIDFPWEVILGFGLIVGMLISGIWAGILITQKVKATSLAIKKNLLGWKEIMDNHNRIRSEWMTYETDLLKMIDYPMLTDMGEPVTIELHKALKNAVMHSPKSLKGLDRVPFADSDYAKAVSELDTAWHVAESKAKLANWSKFDKEEQKNLQRAKDLLNLAMDSGATPSERQISYKAAMKALKGIINAPEKTILAIEDKIRLAVAA